MISCEAEKVGNKSGVKNIRVAEAETPMLSEIVVFSTGGSRSGGGGGGDKMIEHRRSFEHRGLAGSDRIRYSNIGERTLRERYANPTAALLMTKSAAAKLVKGLQGSVALTEQNRMRK